MARDTNSMPTILPIVNPLPHTGSHLRATPPTVEEDNLYEWLRIVPGLIRCRTRAYAEQGPDESQQVCPLEGLVFRALEMVPPSGVRVVILGQDPYHTPGKANGLAFGYHHRYSGPVDSSLLNMVNEGRRSGYDMADSSLEHLADQGVLLLNSCLTVSTGKPLSHCGDIGWEKEVHKILGHLLQNSNCIFVCLGGHSLDLLGHTIGQGGVIEEGRIVVTSHPSNLSHTRELRGYRAFTGSGVFDTINDLIALNGLGRRIQW